MTACFSMAIDGPSGAGKSTIAQAVAQKTGALYLDTGAMYRAVGLWMLRHNVNLRDTAAIARMVNQPVIDVRYVDGVQRLYLDGVDVSEAIRAPEVSMAASAVSAVPQVRARLVAMQQGIARGRSVVMDGRDIGTKVLPNATLKIYLIADLSERARRRTLELGEKGVPCDEQAVRMDMQKRDHDDATRAASPLCKAEDAIQLDSSHLTLAETVERVLDLLAQRLEEGGI
ncbi:MAG: (d)CMP kinase [Clostridia bacterium]